MSKKGEVGREVGERGRRRWIVAEETMAGLAAVCVYGESSWLGEGK